MKLLITGLLLLCVGGTMLLTGCSSSLGDAIGDALPISGEGAREAAIAAVQGAVSGDLVRSAGGVLALLLGAIATAMGGSTVMSRRRRAPEVLKKRLAKATARAKA